MAEQRCKRERLDQIVAEVRAAPAPGLRRDSIERRLIEEFERRAQLGELRPRQLPLGGRAKVWAAFAAAVVLAVGLGWELGGKGRQPHEMPFEPRTALDGSRLHAGALVEALAEHDLHVEHPGRVHWELARGSRARMLEAQMPGRQGALRIELEHGTLTASVEPGGSAESFIVQARGTVVAVHGTRFEVAIEAERVRVSVSSGVVEVRPLNGGSRHLLSAGMRGSFVRGVLSPELDRAPREEFARSRQPEAESQAMSGVQLPSPLAPRSPLAPPSPPPSRSSEAERRPAPASAEPSASQAPKAAPAPLTFAPDELIQRATVRVTERIESCFRRHTPRQGPVSIQVATHLSLRVQPSGLLLEVSLDPPLAPLVERCVARELGDLNLGVSQSGFRVEREIRVGG